MKNLIRKGLKDCWNLKMTDDKWENDIPAYTASNDIPKDVMSYLDAVKEYKKRIKEDKSFHIDKYILFNNIDIFENKKMNMWYRHRAIAKVTLHFTGIIEPFYMCKYSSKRVHHNYNVYKARTIGKHFTNIGQKVIYTFCCSNKESIKISLSGIAKNSIIYIDIHNYNFDIDYKIYKKAIKRLIKSKSPKHFILIGDCKNELFNTIKESDIPYTYFEDKKVYSFKKTIWQELEEDNRNFKGDYPICIPKKQSIPGYILSWAEAVNLYNKEIKKDENFYYDYYVHFYIDDQSFDGPYKGIWANPEYALQILKHFKGIVTVDFSTYQDFPIPIKEYAIYRMNLTGILANKHNLEVINNLRIDYFNAYPNYINENEILSIGTVASSLKEKFYKDLFCKYHLDYFKTHKIKAVVVFGSSNYKPFRYLESINVPVVTFKSKKNKYHEGGDKNV